MPEYAGSPEFKEIVDGTFEIERQLIQKGLAPEVEQALWVRWEWYGDRLRALMQRMDPDPDVVVH
jgi:hypothetical protein